LGRGRKQDVKQKDYLVSELVIGNEASKSQNQKIKKSKNQTSELVDNQTI